MTRRTSHRETSGGSQRQRRRGSSTTTGFGRRSASIPRVCSWRRRTSLSLATTAAAAGGMSPQPASGRVATHAWRCSKVPSACKQSWHRSSAPQSLTVDRRVCGHWPPLTALISQGVQRWDQEGTEASTDLVGAQHGGESIGTIVDHQWRTVDVCSVGEARCQRKFSADSTEAPAPGRLIHGSPNGGWRVTAPLPDLSDVVSPRRVLL